MKALGDFLANIYWIVLAVAAAPILIGFVLRKVAGKHAPDFYEPDSPEFVADCERTRRFWSEQYEQETRRIHDYTDPNTGQGY